MAELLLVMWIATIGADRVDFLRGAGGFILTPFIVVSLFVIALGLISVVHRSGLVKLPRSIPVYAYLVGSLLVLVLLSVLMGNDVSLGAKRFVLLAFQIFATAVGVVLLSHMRNCQRIIVMGAYAAITLTLLINIAMLFAWLPTPLSDAMPQSELIKLTPASLGSYAPRLSGLSLDSNRGGFLLVVYSFLILRFGAKSRGRGAFLILAAIMLMFTLSRSAIAAYIVMMTAHFLLNRKLNFKIMGRFALAGAAIVLVGVLLSRHDTVASSFPLGMLVAERMSFDADTSGGHHLMLIDHGLGIADSSVKSMLTGIGFGSSYTVLHEFFPADKYANFHSMYISFLAECGIVSLILLLALLLLPLVKSRVYLPLVLAILFFNVFYQLVLEPLFWMSLALVWANLKPHRELLAKEPIDFGTPVDSRS